MQREDPSLSLTSLFLLSSEVRRLASSLVDRTEPQNSRGLMRITFTFFRNILEMV